MKRKIHLPALISEENEEKIKEEEKIIIGVGYKMVKRNINAKVLKIIMNHHRISHGNVHISYKNHIITKSTY